MDNIRFTRDKTRLYIDKYMSENWDLGIAFILLSMLMLTVFQKSYILITTAAILMFLGSTAVAGFVMEQKQFEDYGSLRLNKSTGKVSILPFQIKGLSDHRTLSKFRQNLYVLKTKILDSGRLNSINCITHRSVLRIILELFCEFTKEQARQIVSTLENGKDNCLVITEKYAVSVQFSKTMTDPSFAVLAREKYVPRRFYDVKISSRTNIWR